MKKVIPVRVRSAVKRAVNRALRLFGVRVVSHYEDLALRARHERMVEELAAIYREALFPELGERPRRADLLCQLVGTEVPEAMYLLHYLQNALAGSGDVCEMGVGYGATSALIANEILDTDRTLWLYDSFEGGLSTPTDEDVLIDDIFNLGSMESYAHTMASTVEEVVDRIDAVGLPRYRLRIVPGYIQPDLPVDQVPDQVAFAYIDFDLYEPILTGLELMHPRCRGGSILMVDDYGYFSAGVKTAVNQFITAHENQYELLEPLAAAGHFCALRCTGLTT
jgi:hypothetical protein